MSESIYSDPAAPERGGVRISASADPAAPRPDMLTKVVGRWWLVAVCVGVGVAAAFAYFAAAKKTYTSRCVITAEIERGDGAGVAAAGAAGGVAPDEFLFQQRDVIKSTPVLANAATTLIKSETAVRDALDVAVGKGEGVLTISYSAGAADEAALGANAVADAYLRTRVQQQTSATSGLGELTKQRDQLTAERTKHENAMREFRRTASTTGSEAERAAAARLEQLQQALATADVELAKATADATAAKVQAADPKQFRTIVEANRGKGIFDRLDSQRSTLESELAQVEKQLEKQRQTMLPEHPVVVATKRKHEQLQTKLMELDKEYPTVYTAYLEQQRSTAQKRVDEVKQLIAGQSAQAKDAVARAAKLAEMDAEMKKTDASIAEVDKKIREVTLKSGAVAAPTVKVVVPAQAPSRATRPDRDRTILTGAMIGFVAGLALAAIVPRRRQ